MSDLLTDFSVADIQRAVRYSLDMMSVIRANDKTAPYRRKLFIEEKCDLFLMAAIKAF